MGVCVLIPSEEYASYNLISFVLLWYVWSLKISLSCMVFAALKGQISAVNNMLMPCFCVCVNQTLRNSQEGPIDSQVSI